MYGDVFIIFYGHFAIIFKTFKKNETFRKTKKKKKKKIIDMIL